ncbi:hypothetical protein [Fibrobacter sp.]|uniref:hypothetical protein n=1 Tax=Fibrobacter sp. TaxID=35828 RepID=UPI00388CF658
MKNPERNGSSMFDLRAKILVFFLLTVLSTTFAQPTEPPQYTLPSPQDSIWSAPTGPDPAVRENDAGRWVLPIREMMQRTYDVSGQKSEWVLGTSILGRPELDPFVFGIGSISSRYPSELSGLYTTRLGYDPTTIGLNGENGILYEERHGIPVDTPITDLNWERSGFMGNGLHLDFRRLVTDSVTLDFGLQSRSDKDSKEYEYQNVTHSPYFALGRDSSSIPFAGRNIAVNTMHFQPLLTWRFGYGKAFLKMNFLSLENADNTSHKVLLDTLDLAKRTFQKDPYTIDIESRTYGAGIEVYPIKKLTVGTSIQYGTHDIELDSMGGVFDSIRTWTDTLGYEKKDSIFYDTMHVYSYETILGEFNVRYASLLNPTLRFEYEFLNTNDRFNYDKDDEYSKDYFQDREVGYAQVSDTLGIFMFRAQAGMQRNSSMLDEVDYAPAYSGDATMMLPFHLRLNGGMRHDNKYPDVSQFKFNETGRMQFANEKLKAETRDRLTSNIGWYSREAFYGLGIRYEQADNLIRRHWLKGIDSDSSITKAFQWTNIGYAETWDWMFQVGFRLGNWKFYLERGETLKRHSVVELLDTPELYYKGSIHWQNRFVQNRLGVSIRVDWQWFDNRFDCTINEFGKAEVEELKKYLALDFEARMQILTFELYNRIDNFNHSIYMPASGYTPEGLRFSYGIVWTFSN